MAGRISKETYERRLVWRDIGQKENDVVNMQTKKRMGKGERGVWNLTVKLGVSGRHMVTVYRDTPITYAFAFSF